MANWYFYDNYGYKIGPIRGRELTKLAEQGTITPNTRVEDENGRAALAKNVTGLSFPGTVQSEPNPFADAPPVTDNPFVSPSPFVPPMQEVPTSPSPPVANLFCTNCGNIVFEQAIACMSCGAKPIGHKKFCRQCGVGLNPEQVVCIQCGAGLAGGVGNTIKDLASTFQSTEFTSSIAEKIKNLPKPVIGAGIAIFAISLCLLFVNVLATGLPKLTPVEKMEVDRILAEHGRNAIAYYLEWQRDEERNPDMNRVLKYLKPLVSQRLSQKTGNTL